MTDQQRIRDHSHDRRYFTMVPHLVTDMLLEGEIAPLTFALYVYLRRHCGEHGDVYSESIRATATRLRLSVGAIYTARKQLVDASLIYLNLVGPVGHETAEITIRDVWPDNMERYARKARAEAAEEEGLRSNSERKSRRASGGGRTQNEVGVQIVNAPPDASVQILNAPIPLPENVKEPEEPGKKPADAQNVVRDEARPVGVTSVAANIEDGVAYVVERYVSELGDNDPRKTAIACTHLLYQSGLEPGEFHNAMKAAASETRRRMTGRPLTNPAAYWQTTLRTCIDQRRAAVGLPPLPGVPA